MTFLKSREAILIGVLVVLIGLISTRFPSFVAPQNLIAVFTDTSPLVILALGQMAVILTRCIDLSVAANLALTGMVCAMLNVAAPDLPIVVVLLVALLLGAALGAINGLFVWKLGIPSIVVTLGTMTIYRGMTFVISEGQWVNAHEMSPNFTHFPRQEIVGIPVMAWFALTIFAIMVIAMNRTVLGRSFYAVGGNPNAAVYTGINVGRSQFFAFTLSGMLAGLCGYLWVARYAVAYVDIASGFELDVVAACVIGGLSLRAARAQFSARFLARFSSG